MQETYTKKNSLRLDDEIDIRELFKIIIQGKWIILSVTSIVSIIGVIYSLSLPNIYISKALLVPVNPSNSISGSLRSYSNLAGLAGINFPSSSDQGNSVKAIQKIGSLSFFENNILPNIFLPELMAFESWDYKLNSINFNKNIYNIDNNSWVRNYSYPQQPIPSPQESYKVFKNNHLDVNQDAKSGFISISVKHQSPFIAKQWTELVVKEINGYYRKKDKEESEKAINYLNNQILMTDLSEIKQVLAQLMQEEIKKLSLIEANKYYVFDYIDPPAVMEKKSEPKRSLICILSAVLGGILSIFIVFAKHYVFKKIQNNSSLK
jgi:LPS O-antigen subunit length determinant protein (WzzB/FepE family)